MNLFDLRTAYLLMGLLYLLMPAVVWVALRGQRSPTVAAWCAGGGAMGVGIFMLATLGLAPRWFSLLGGNGVVMGGLALRMWALRRESGLRPHGLAHAAGAMSALAAYEFLRSALDNAPLAAWWATGVQGAMCACLSLWSGRLARQERSLHAGFIAVAYGLLSAALLFRVLSITLAWGNMNLLADPRPTPDLIALSISGILVAVISHIGYLALYLERSKRREVAQAGADARKESARRLGAQVAQLERHRSLGLVALSLSHELTQPLAAIAAQARTAQRAASSADDAGLLTGTLTRILDNAMRAGALVERIRAFIRPDNQPRAALELGQLARDVSELVEDEARHAGVQFSLPAADERAWVQGDRVTLSQILLNAYLNAMDASRQSRGARVEVRASREGDRVRLCVRDHGPGLGDEAMRRAGEPFFTTKTGGLGVGLAVSRALAEQHGGTLSLANAEGGGAIFVLELPAHEGPAA